MELYEYQQEALDAVMRDWACGVQRPAVVLPTGMGKTVIFAKLMERAASIGLRPLALMHRDELIDQTVKKLEVLAPGLKLGVVKGLRNETVGRDAIVASVQTLGRQARLDQFHRKDVTAVIVDECHHAAADSYVRVLDHFRTMTPHSNAYAAGFTATMDRGDARKLGAVWDKVTYTKDILWGIMHGYLCDVRGLQVPIKGLDLRGLGLSKGDYQDGQLEDALAEADAYAQTAKGYGMYARREDGSLRPGILFAPTVSGAAEFAREMNAAGIRAAVVVGTTPKDERLKIYADFATGKLDVISSCMVLTEGFDAPHAEVCVIARPTQMTHLYIQMVGRVLRTFPGKPDALVLDVTGVTGKHTLASLNVLVPAVDMKPVELKPNELLTDGVIRTQDAIKYLRGEILTANDVDLFDRSQSAWLRTKGGTWFIPTRSGYFFLAISEKDATWMVGKTATQYAKRGRAHTQYHEGKTSQELVLSDTWGWLRRGLTLDYAMLAAEGLADDLDGSVSSRKASWRSTREPSEPQKTVAKRAGIEFPPGTRRGAAGDLLSIHFASKLFDPRKA